MVKNTQNTQKLTKKETFLISLKNNLGHISNACISAHIHRRTYYSWIEKDKEFKDKCDDVNEGLVDLVESKLFENIKNNDNTCILFFLKCKAKSRGYRERQEIELTRPIEDIIFDEI